MVFLRWGIFGILAFAAVWLVWNSSKRLAERRESRAKSVAVLAPATPVDIAGPPIEICEVELTVAQRAIDAHASGDPIDRLLRSREIAFETDSARRERLIRIAYRWFEFDPTIDPVTLRNTVYGECEKPKPP